ncbi:MAG: efflux RND transporter periplasmic adaptor subunit [Patescibacteria group bacterium]
MVKKIIIIILIIFVGWFVWQRYNNKDENAGVDSYIVERDNVVETISVSGELVPVEYANLSFAAPALVEWIGVDVGDTVEEGQVLVKLDRDAIYAEIASARIDVEKAVSVEQQARRKWDRYKPEERERMKKDVEQAKARLYRSQTQVSNVTLVSPINGVVTQKNVRIGEIASGTVMRVIDESDMEIEVLISETDAAKMHEGQRAFAVFDAYNDEEFKVNIVSIDPEAVKIQDVTYYKVDFVLTERVGKKILSGMSVDVDVVVASEDNVLTAPLRFIRHDNEGDFVYVSGAGGGYERKYVQTGIESDDGDVEIVSGVNDGEAIYAVYEDE